LCGLVPPGKKRKGGNAPSGYAAEKEEENISKKRTCRVSKCNIAVKREFQPGLEKKKNHHMLYRVNGARKKRGESRREGGRDRRQNLRTTAFKQESVRGGKKRIYFPQTVWSRFWGRKEEATI